MVRGAGDGVGGDRVRLCSIAGCDQPHDARGYCRRHYKKLIRYGIPDAPDQLAPDGAGWVSRGRRWFTVDGKKKLQSHIVAERALGKPLPKEAIVHHVDENPMNDSPCNLVICQSRKYHHLLHMRLDALKATGHAHWRKCPFCCAYDDPQFMREEMTSYSPRFVHSACRAAAQKRRRNHAI